VEKDEQLAARPTHSSRLALAIRSNTVFVVHNRSAGSKFRGSTVCESVSE